MRAAASDGLNASEPVAHTTCVGWGAWSGHGFKFAPVLGDIIADAVEGRPNPAGAPFKWRTPPPGAVREAEACRAMTGGPERLVVSSTL